MSEFVSPFHSLSLQRIPIRRRETLQAWDAADEYLLNYFKEQAAEQVLDGNTNVLVCNDNFGALCLNLKDFNPVHYSDSHIAELALEHNAQLNALPPSLIKTILSTEKPEGSWDVVLMKLPKNQSWFREQLLQIKPFLHSGSKVVVAAMVKHLPHSALEQMELIVGPSTLSKAKKKARLLLTDVNVDKKIPTSKYPKHWQVDSGRQQHNGLKLVNYANTFSRDSLDIGARFFIEHLPSGVNGRIIDMGCGNGIIGMATALQNSGPITFVDESHMAVASARDGWQANGLSASQATFQVNDSLQGFPANSADCILCNPPFHQQNTVGGQIAQQMFRDAYKVLKTGGEFRVIGNRHLDYHALMKKLFGNCKLVASDSKFVILSSVR